METKTKEIDIEKKYNIPSNLIEVTIDDKILIISVDTSNWIVLNDEEEKIIFNKLKSDSIEKVAEFIEKQGIELNKLISVLTQIEAKDFENTKVTYPENQGMYMYLTNKCNLRCKHCYMFAGEEKLNELTTEEIFKVLDDFKINGGRVVTFTGGEVTERKDLCELLKHSKENELKNTVLTNGTEWTLDLINRIQPYVDEVQISVDGYDEESNSVIRGKGSFNKALKTAELFFEKNIKLSIAVTPLFEDLESRKFKYIEFGRRLINKFNREDFQLKFNYELLKGRDINLSKEANTNYSKIMHEIVEACYKDSEENEFVENHKDNMVLNNCGYGGITIAANGDVYFCNRIHELKSYGNVRNTEFKKIMKLSSTAQQLSNINNLKPCNKCDLKYICGGGCRIEHFPELINLNSLELINNTENIKARTCSKEVKDKYYRMMIKTNERFFK